MLIYVVLILHLNFNNTYFFIIFLDEIEKRLKYIHVFYLRIFLSLFILY